MLSDASTGSGLPRIKEVPITAPLSWVAGGWADFQKAMLPCLVYGVGLALVSSSLISAILFSGAAGWVMVFLGGFVFIAPMIAMGLYEAGRRLEAGERPRLAELVFVRTASTRDLAYLGLALCVIYFFWTRMAQLVYALSTFTLHKSVIEFLNFMVSTPEGWSMAMTGCVVGAIIGFIAFSIVVISAPMLLERDTDVFVATVTSVRAVAANPPAMMVWAVILAVLTMIGLVTAGLAFIVIFPVTGLASWRAYRALVERPA